jgi:hypothetical protein
MPSIDNLFMERLKLKEIEHDRAMVICRAKVKIEVFMTIAH